MKTLSRKADEEEILRRLRQIKPDSARRWGKMSPHEMVCHLTDSFRVVMGEKPSSEVSSPLPRTLMKWFALYIPLHWPKGVPAPPEVDQHQGGTRPVEFAADKDALLSLIARFTHRPRDFEWQPHPLFRQMPEKDWMRWAYLHTDHHLRQFGS
jgi:Protein of unknown function (DUF1569)